MHLIYSLMNIAKKRIKQLILVIAIAAVVIFYAAGGGDYLSLPAMQQLRHEFFIHYQQQPYVFMLLYFLAYVTATALSLPLASLMTLLAGSLFGFTIGLVLASFASTLGACLAFLMARFVLQESIQQRYGDSLKPIHQGFQQEGNFYLFALRLVPVFPFFMINLVMGLLHIKAIHFYWVSQLGMLPGTAVYVFAGTELSKISTLSDITSPSLLAAFALLGLLPIASKKALLYYRAKS